MCTRKNPVRRAFTLIEILIVVVILGILAAIVIPQFTDASEDAMMASVQSQLQTLRGQVELFRVQNAGVPSDLVLVQWLDLVDGDYVAVGQLGHGLGLSHQTAFATLVGA